MKFSGIQESGLQADGKEFSMLHRRHLEVAVSATLRRNLDVVLVFPWVSLQIWALERRHI